MSDSTVTGAAGVTTADSGLGDLRDAAVAGVAAGLVFGVVIQAVLGRMTAIGAMYTLGEPSLSVGWVAHLVHSAVFAALFGVVTWWRALSAYVDAPATSIVVGAGYGAVLWFVNIGFVWPLWLNAVGLTELPFPYLTAGAVRPLMGHLLWGGLLGAGYALLRAR